MAFSANNNNPFIGNTVSTNNSTIDYTNHKEIVEDAFVDEPKYEEPKHEAPKKGDKKMLNNSLIPSYIKNNEEVYPCGGFSFASNSALNVSAIIEKKGFGFNESIFLQFVPGVKNDNGTNSYNFNEAETIKFSLEELYELAYYLQNSYSIPENSKYFEKYADSSKSNFNKDDNRVIKTVTLESGAAVSVGKITISKAYYLKFKGKKNIDIQLPKFNGPIGLGKRLENFANYINERVVTLTNYDRAKKA